MTTFIKITFDKIGEFFYDEEKNEMNGIINVNPIPIDISCFEIKELIAVPVPLEPKSYCLAIKNAVDKGFVKKQMNWSDVCQAGMRYSQYDLELILPLSSLLS